MRDSEPVVESAAAQVGRPISRVEGYDKVTGRARYTADFAFPDLAYGILVQSGVPHGRVTAESLRASTERACKADGVLHVLTPLTCPALQVLPRALTHDLPLERRPPLSDLTVQHVGQHMALVVADTWENATHGPLHDTGQYALPHRAVRHDRRLGRRHAHRA